MEGGSGAQGVGAGGVDQRRGRLGKLKVPENSAALRTEVAARWGIIDLLDFLKESDFVTDFTDAFTTVATREATPRE